MIFYNLLYLQGIFFGIFLHAIKTEEEESKRRRLRNGEEDLYIMKKIKEKCGIQHDRRKYAEEYF